MPSTEAGFDIDEQRVRERAYHLWQADGEPLGNDLEYWERASLLIRMEANPEAGQLPNPVHPGEDRPSSSPPVEEAELQDNLGEFPSSLSDQGDRRPTPVPAHKPRRSGAS